MVYRSSLGNEGIVRMLSRRHAFCIKSRSVYETAGSLSVNVLSPFALSISDVALLELLVLELYSVLEPWDLSTLFVLTESEMFDASWGSFGDCEVTVSE